MSANGISTLSTKAARRTAKLTNASNKRKVFGTNGYRKGNNISGTLTVSPVVNRPYGIDINYHSGNGITAI